MLQTRSPVVLFGSYTLLLAAAGAGVLRALADLGSTNPTASHHILIPLVTVALIVQNRAAVLAVRRPAPSSGIAVILLGTVLLWLGQVSTAGPVNPLAVGVAGLVIAWAGGFLLLFGPGAVRASLFPLLFLGFMIPIPETVLSAAIEVLKSGSTEAVDGLFTLTGTPFHREGFVFHLPKFVIEVADECSGIRSSIALLLTAALAGHAVLGRAWTRAVLLLVVLPITILKNGVRIVSLTLLATHVDSGFLTGQLHHEGGIVFFVLALAMLAPVLAILRRSETIATTRAVVQGHEALSN